jgi:protein-tyrosine phosphatase
VERSDRVSDEQEREGGPVRVLFVCMGNICRSPMAEAVFRHKVAEAGLAERFEIDSAGTGGWHVGEPPHHGTLSILARHGVDPGPQRARQLAPADFARCHYVVAMDEENLSELRRFRRDPHARVSLLLDHAPGVGEREVPDPYYSGGFEHVYRLVEAGCEGLLAEIRRREGI